MSESCPLQVGDHFWDAKIPETCIEQCSEIWDEASQGPGQIDTFSTSCEDSHNGPCEHDVEFGGEALQRTMDPSAALRIYANNYQCIETKSELFAEEYEFDCPHNNSTPSEYLI